MLCEISVSHVVLDDLLEKRPILTAHRLGKRDAFAIVFLKERIVVEADVLLDGVAPARSP